MNNFKCTWKSTEDWRRVENHQVSKVALGWFSNLKSLRTFLHLLFNPFMTQKIEVHRFEINKINILAEIVYQLIFCLISCSKPTEAAATRLWSAWWRNFPPIRGRLSRYTQLALLYGLLGFCWSSNKRFHLRKEYESLCDQSLRMRRWTRQQPSHHCWRRGAEHRSQAYKTNL